MQHKQFHTNRLFNGLDKDTYLSLTKPAVVNQQYQDDGAIAIIDIDGYIGRDIIREWITGEKSKNTVENIRSVLREINSEKIIVNINSPGGDLNDGLVIYNLLQAHRAEIVTNVLGFSASAATVIAQAGNLRRMPETAFKLYHRVMFGLMGYFNQNSFREMTDDAEVIDSVLIKMISGNSNMSENKVAELMDGGGGYGKWISAEEALDNGMIDEIYDPADESDDNTDHLDGEDKENRMRNIQKLNASGKSKAEVKVEVDTSAVEELLKNFKQENKRNSGSGASARARKIRTKKRTR